MPFTPLHMGPGIAIKAVLQGSFSLMVFGWTQIVMDLQPLFVMITGEGPLHGFSHSYVGGSLLAVFSALTGKTLSEIGLYVLGLDRQRQIEIRWWVAFLSAFLGAWTHVLLDSVMHFDVQPFAPFTTVNAFQGWVTIATLHRICFYSAAIGGAVFFLIAGWRSRIQASSG